jgi:UDP-N-acetylmuramoyl-tripeptide--D-alanyl-D-alanine ligase
MGELGEDSRLLHDQVGQQIRLMGAMRLLAIGPDAKSTADAFGNGAVFFETQEAMISMLKKELTGVETILVKGSRKQKMEHVVSALMQGCRH